MSTCPLFIPSRCLLRLALLCTSQASTNAVQSPLLVKHLFSTGEIAGAKGPRCSLVSLVGCVKPSSPAQTSQECSLLEPCDSLLLAGEAKQRTVVCGAFPASASLNFSVLASGSI